MPNWNQAQDRNQAQESPTGSVRLHQVFEYLESKGILTGINLNQHANCPLLSNCPLAIQTRRILLEAKIKVEDIRLPFIQQPQTFVYELNQLREFPISGKLSLTLGKTVIEADVSEALKEEVGRALKSKVAHLEDSKKRLESIGLAVLNSFQTEVNNLRRTKLIPQLNFDKKLLMETKVLVTGSGTSYWILVPFLYNPHYIITDGIRYFLSPRDVKLLETPCYLVFQIKEGQIHDPQICTESGLKLTHYHGDTHNDCWGNVKFERKWDGTLEQILRTSTLIVGSLATINKDSLMQHAPSPFPPAEALLERATRMGREGEFRKSTVETTRPNPTGRIWGRR